MPTTAHPAPFRLDEGIELEDTGLLIRWGTPIEDLAAFGSPTITRHPNSVHPCWPGRICLGGLLCDVRAIQIFEPPNPRAFHVYLPEFHRANLIVRSRWGASDREIEQGFRSLYGHLEWALGSPTFSYSDYERGLPSIFWELPGLQLGYSLSSGRASIAVAHEPDGYADLKSEAQAIRSREGEGARVDYVAWPERRGQD